MDFQGWVARLRAGGYRVCPASTAVPVEVWGLRPDGSGFHLRCRGVRVRLALYRPGRAAWQVPIASGAPRPEEEVSGWERHPVGRWEDAPADARLVFDGGPADAHAIFDGGHERGWTGHEAGLLRPAEAAVLFHHLLTALDPPGPPARGRGVVSWRNFQGV